MLLMYNRGAGYGRRLHRARTLPTDGDSLGRQVWLRWCSGDLDRGLLLRTEGLADEGGERRIQCLHARLARRLERVVCPLHRVELQASAARAPRTLERPRVHLGISRAAHEEQRRRVGAQGSQALVAALSAAGSEELERERHHAHDCLTQRRTQRLDPKRIALSRREQIQRRASARADADEHDALVLVRHIKRACRSCSDALREVAFVALWKVDGKHLVTEPAKP
mmetsp:Transcript_33837/g.72222  ORF Transcript_33837/g.72222 Transcript_33837/m.72222 type:complete len:225 (-) Transcript_33837:335-1009(-)